MSINSYYEMVYPGRDRKGLKRLLLAVLVLLVAFGMIPLTGLGGATDEVYADGPTVLTVYRQLGSTGTPEPVKEYSQDDLDALASTEPVGYEVKRDDGWNFYGTNNYVKLDDVLKDSGVKTGASGSNIIGSGYVLDIGENPGYMQTFTYQDLKGDDYYWYPAATSATASSQGAIKAPPVIALTDTGRQAITTTAQNDLTAALEGTLGAHSRFMYGWSHDAFAAGTPAATKYAQNTDTIIVIEPVLESFEVYVQKGATGTLDLWKTYTRAELETIAKNDPRGFLMAGWQVHASSNYVTLEDLLADNHIAMTDVVSVSPVAGSDGFSRDFSADALAKGQYFYPATGESSTNVAGATTVGAVIALDWNSARVAGTAAETLQNIVTADVWEPSGRFYIGLSEADYLAGTAPGWRFITGPSRLNVVVRDYAEEISQLENEKETLEEQISAIDEQLAQESSKNSQLTGANTQLTNDKTQLTNEKNQLIKEKADLQKQLDAANQAVFKGTAAKISKLTAGKKKATLTWKKIAKADGYQVVYATSSKFKSKRTATVKSGSTVKKAVTKLTKGKTYYFKVRGYAKIGGKTVYTKYSPVKRVKITK